MTTFTRIQLAGDTDLMVFPKIKSAQDARFLLDEYKKSMELSSLTADEIINNVTSYVGDVVKKVTKEHEAYKELTPDLPESKFTYRINKAKKLMNELVDLVNAPDGLLIREVINASGGVPEGNYPLEMNFSDEEKIALDTYKFLRDLIENGVSDEVVEAAKASINADEFKAMKSTKAEVTAYFKANKYEVYETAGVTTLLTV